MKIAIGISGASGAIYAKRLIEYLHNKHELYVTASKYAIEIFKSELNEDFFDFIASNSVKYFHNEDMHSLIASGSFKIDACIIVPCSMKTLSAIANGYADSLLSRCADVALKENRKLIIVPRETPFSQIHLANMLTLSKAGALIVPPNPAFYNHPESIDDIVDFIVGRILDLIGINNSLYKKWTG